MKLFYLLERWVIMIDWFCIQVSHSLFTLCRCLSTHQCTCTQDRWPRQSTWLSVWRLLSLLVDYLTYQPNQTMNGSVRRPLLNLVVILNLFNSLLSSMEAISWEVYMVLKCWGFRFFYSDSYRYTFLTRVHYIEWRTYRYDALQKSCASGNLWRVWTYQIRL